MPRRTHSKLGVQWVACVLAMGRVQNGGSNMGIQNLTLTCTTPKKAKPRYSASHTDSHTTCKLTLPASAMFDWFGRVSTGRVYNKKTYRLVDGDIIRGHVSVRNCIDCIGLRSILVNSVDRHEQQSNPPQPMHWTRCPQPLLPLQAKQGIWSCLIRKH